MFSHRQWLEEGDISLQPPSLTLDTPLGGFGVFPVPPAFPAVYLETAEGMICNLTLRRPFL